GRAAATGGRSLAANPLSTDADLRQRQDAGVASGAGQAALRQHRRQVAASGGAERGFQRRSTPVRKSNRRQWITDEWTHFAIPLSRRGDWIATTQCRDRSRSRQNWSRL